MDLLDPPLKNGKYTWSNKQLGPGHIAARLDHVLVRSSILDLSVLASSHILPSAILDHRHVSLDLSLIGNIGPFPFRFSSTWIKESGLFEAVQN